MISTPKELYLSDTYRFSYEAEGVDVTLSRFAEDKTGLHAEMLVTTDRQPYAGLLRDGRINLSAIRSQQEAVNALRKRVAPGFLDDVDFDGIISQVCRRAKEHWRQGDAIVNLRTVDYRERPRWLLEPFVEYGGPTVLFALGGSGKSLFALSVAVSIATGLPTVAGYPSAITPVLYVDWEADSFTHAERLAAVCAGYGIEVPDMFYKRSVASLAEGAESLQLLVAQLGIGFIVVDSVGAARSGDPASAELTIKLFSAIRGLNLPVLCIDHAVKDPNAPKDHPFGSVYTTNMARITWRMDTIQVEGSSEAAISMSNTKINNGRLAKRRGYRAVYETNGEDRLISVRYETAEIHQLPEFTATLSQRDQVVAALRANNKSMHPEEISEWLKSEYAITLEANNVRSILSRGSKDSKTAKALFVQDATQRGAWGLMSWRTA